MDYVKMTTNINSKYQRLMDKAIQRGHARIHYADNRISATYCPGLCAHNWGNDAAKRELDRMDKLTSYIIQRKDREYEKALHVQHVLDNQVGVFLWCKECQMVS